MEYKILRSRRKSLAIEITPRGEVLVRTPLRMAKRDIQRFVESKQGWIVTHLSKIHTAPALTAEEHTALICSAKEILPVKADRYARLLGVSYNRITIRSQKSRWGSCSAAGNLNFNCLLMLAPEEVQNYVVVHELCHRKHMDHSPAFWQEVEKILPEYRQQKAWLKEHGSSLLARLPLL